jgi:hypothetical protein
MIQELIGYFVKCGGDECSEVLFFEHFNDTTVCPKCGASCDLTGAVWEYETLAVRVIQMAKQTVDGMLNQRAERGWLVYKMEVVKEPDVSGLVAVYLLRRLVANVRYITDLKAKVAEAAVGG